MKLKFTQIVAGIIFLVASLFFGFILFGIFATDSSINVSDSLWIWTIPALVVAILTDSGISFLKSGFAIDGKKIDQIPGNRANLSSSVARSLTIVDIIFLCIVSFMGIIALVFLSNRFYQQYAPYTLQIHTQIYVILATWLIYTILRLTVFNKMGNKVVEQSGLNFKLENNAIVFTWNTVDLIKGPQQNIITIRFDEIDSVSQLSFREAQGYTDYKIGADLSLAYASTKDQIKYFKKQIDKPRYLVYGPTTGAIHLLITGKDLIYLVQVSNTKEECDALIEAYNSYKKI